MRNLFSGGFPAALALGLFSASSSLQASDACTVDSGVLVCGGDQSDGQILINPGLPVVISSDTPIARDDGTPAILYWATTPPADVEVNAEITTANGGAVDYQLSIDEQIHYGLALNGTISSDFQTVTVISTHAGEGAITGHDGTITASGKIDTQSTNVPAMYVWNRTLADNDESPGQAASATAGSVEVTVEDVSAPAAATTVNMLQDTQATDWGGVPVTANGGRIAFTSTGLVDSSAGFASGIAIRSYTLASGWGDSQAEGGVIDISVNDVTASGDYARAIAARSETYAQTEPGLGTSSATGGEISIATSGAVAAEGEGGIAIQASMIVSGDEVAQGHIDIAIADGEVRGGAGSGTGIFLDGQANATISNAGTLSAGSGWAVKSYNAGATHIDNSGRLQGSIEGGNVTVANTGRYDIGETAWLAPGIGLQNDGIISAGGAGHQQHSLISSGLMQGIGGVLEVDIDWDTGTADFIEVWEKAELAGTVIVNAVNEPATAGLVQQFYILTAYQGVDDLGLSVIDTATVDYELEISGNDIFLLASINFQGLGEDGLDGNQATIAQTLNAHIESGANAGLDGVVQGLTGLGSSTELAAALDGLSPQIYGYQVQETAQTAEAFAKDMQSCRVAGAGAAAIVAEGQCLWARTKARRAEFDAGGNAIGAAATSWGFSGGGQVAVAEHWHVGLAGGYEQSRVESGMASAHTDRGQAGLSLKHILGPFSLSAIVTGGWGQVDTARGMHFGGFATTGYGNSDIGYASGKVQAAYVLNGGSLYLKPLAEATVTNVWQGGVTESSIGGGALTVGAVSDTFLSLAQALEVGGNWQAGGQWLRPYLRAGLTWRDRDRIGTSARFAGAGGPDFAVVTEIDAVVGDVAAGFDVVSDAGMTVRIEGDGRFGASEVSYGGSLKASVAF